MKGNELVRKKGRPALNKDQCREFEAKYKYVRKWMDSMTADFSGSEATRKGYLQDLDRFCAWCGIDPDSLIEERIQDFRSQDPELEDRAESRIKTYTRHLKEELKFKKNTVKRRIGAVRSFYRNAYPRGRLLSKMPRGTKKSKTKSVDKSVIRRCLISATPHQRAAILIVYQGLFRPVTLAAIPARRFLWAIEREEIPVNIHVESEENKGEEIAYDTFIDADAVEAIRALGELDPDKPLLGEEANIGKLIREARKSVKGLKETVNARVLRSSGASHMRTAGVPEAHVEEFQGHVMKYGGAYANFPIEDLRESYRKAKMNIWGNATTTTTEDMNRLKKEFAAVIHSMAVAAKLSGRPEMLDALVQYAESQMDIEWNGEGTKPLFLIIREILNRV